VRKYRAWLRNPQGVWYMEYDPFLERVCFSDGGIERLSINDLAERIINLMEFVGVHDGKDIWQGDIIRLTSERFNKQETHVVYWDAEKACYGPFHHFIDDEDRWMDVEYTVEVLGNCCEPPTNVAKENER